MMMHSDLYSSVLSRNKLTILEPDNGGVEAQTRAQGAIAETVANPSKRSEAFKCAKAAAKISVIRLQVDPFVGWATEGHTSWNCRMPRISYVSDVTQAHSDRVAARLLQRKGV